MKPSKINKDNATHVAKFDAAMADGSPYWLEEKIDGCHYLNIRGRFFSTHISEETGSPVEKTEHFPHIIKALEAFKGSQLILDGEINYPGMKSNDVTKITGCGVEEALRRQAGKPIHYRIFDILRAPDGTWLINEPLWKRKEILMSLAEFIETEDFIKINPWWLVDKQQMLDLWLAQGKEGGVLKHKDGKYVCGQRPMWNQLKCKQELDDDVIIIGFEPPERITDSKNLDTWQYWENGDPVTKNYHRGWIGSIQIGKYRKGELVPVGKVTGIDESLRAQFSTTPELFLNRVIKIKAMEMTKDGAYRHANFVEFHPDKNAKECILE